MTEYLALVLALLTAGGVAYCAIKNYGVPDEVFAKMIYDSDCFPFSKEFKERLAEKYGFRRDE